MFLWRALWLTGILLAFLSKAHADSPLHQRIDELIEARAGFNAATAAISTDAEFLRRITLDLTGTIPSPAAVREFLADPASDKRAKLTDALLASPEYARHMQYTFDVMLMERRPDKHVKAPEWQAYLRQSFQENKSWKQLVTEILSADGSDETLRPAAKFLLDRELVADDVTRDMGRIFLGRDLQCAQCHDHPSVDDYLQRHYYGLAAFIKRSYLFKDPGTGLTSIGEKAEGDVEFTSVFTGESDKTSPRMLDLTAYEDPPAAEEPYKVKPDKTARAIPVYSRRLLLASAMTDDLNQPFRENIANRLWAMMMGRGLVEPLDMWHTDNPPTHPDVLALLADDLMSHGYDMRYLLRELALSRTYQRSSPRSIAIASADNSSAGTELDPVSLLKPLTPEQLAWSMMQATGIVDLKLKQLEQKSAEKSDAPPQTIDSLLQSEVKAFVDVFGTTSGQALSFDAAAEQALFLRNGGLIQGWLSINGGLCTRLQSMENAQIAEEFYLSLFSRLPNQEEASQIAAYLENHLQRNTAIQQLVWAALVSSEFRFNH